MSSSMAAIETRILAAKLAGTWHMPDSRSGEIRPARPNGERDVRLLPAELRVYRRQTMTVDHGRRTEAHPHSVPGGGRQRNPSKDVGRRQG